MTAARAAPGTDRDGRYKWLAFGVLAVGLFASVSDHGSVNVALPTIADHYLTDLPTAQWVIVGYALTISALLVPMGRLSDIVGRKRVYIAGFTIFVICGVLAGLSPNVLTLILAKVLQGVGAAMTQGTSMAMLLSAFPNEERGKALGLQMSVVGTGGIAGPALGGMLVSMLGWRSVFFGGAALGVVAVVAGIVVLEAHRATARDGERDSFDWIGAGLSTALLVTFLLGMTLGPRYGWLSPTAFAALFAFLGLLALFVWWELRVESPMMELRLFRRRLFTLGVSASFTSFLGMSSIRFLMPFYLQAVKGYSPGQVGLIIVPSALCMAVLGPLSGRLSDRYGWRLFNVGGLLLSAAGLFILSTITVDSPLALVMSAMVLQSMGIGTFNAPNNSSILSTVEQSRYGTLSGFLNLVRNSANVTGIALVTAIVTASMASAGYEPNLSVVSEGSGRGLIASFTSGLRVAYLAMGVLIVAGVAMSWFKGGASVATETRGRATRSGATSPGSE